jgi:hypothetical protein
MKIENLDQALMLRGQLNDLTKKVNEFEIKDDSTRPTRGIIFDRGGQMVNITTSDKALIALIESEAVDYLKKQINRIKNEIEAL